MILHDVTERKRAGEAQSFLAEASTLMGGSLDEQTTLAIVADMTVPHLADWCAIHMVEEDGSFCEAVLAHQDTAKVERVREILGHNPLNPDAPHGPPCYDRATAGSGAVW